MTDHHTWAYGTYGGRLHWIVEGYALCGRVPSLFDWVPRLVDDHRSAPCRRCTQLKAAGVTVPRTVREATA